MKKNEGISEEVPEDFNLLYTAQEIDMKIGFIAKEICLWISEHQSRGHHVVACPILCGGDFLLSDLKPLLPLNMAYGFIRTHAYQEGEPNRQLEDVSLEYLSFDPKAKAILLVDDIRDRGSTLKTVVDYLGAHGAIDVRSLVLVCREGQNPVTEPTWSLFQYSGNKWLVGRGMQRRGWYRNARNIYTIDS